MGAKTSELFIKSHDFNKAKSEVKDMIDNLKRGMKNLIQNSDWLDEGNYTMRIIKENFNKILLKKQELQL